MNRRENLLRTLRRKTPEFVPLSFGLCNSQHQCFIANTGCHDYMEYYKMCHREVSIGGSSRSIDFSVYFRELPQEAYFDEWGVGYAPGTFEHFTRMLHPMENFVTPTQVMDFPVPDILEDYRWSGFQERVNELKEKGLAAVYSAIQIFEPAWYLRGMENLMMDMIDNPDMARACLDRLTEINIGICERLAAADVDMIVYGDDVGSQKGMLMSPGLWRKWLKPRTEAVIKAAKRIKPDILAYYHSDGVIYDIIPDLIEIGVDVLNPIQPECLDPILIKKLYGDRLSFWGTIGTQTTMPFGTPDQVDGVVKEMIETVGNGGGLVIAPTHLLEPEVPWANIEALVNAVQKYGGY